MIDINQIAADLAEALEANRRIAARIQAVKTALAEERSRLEIFQRQLERFERQIQSWEEYERHN